MEFRRSSGVLLHPTSLPGRYGIGDLGQPAYDFIDFLAKGRQTLWQILPLNPTGFGDSPYQSFSTFAGNPLLISPDCLLAAGYLAADDLDKPPLFDAHAVDYDTVNDYKNRLFKKAFAGFSASASAAQRAAFDAFRAANAAWLNDFCLFIAIKNHLMQEREKEWQENTDKPAGYLAFQKETDGLLPKNGKQYDYYYGASWQSWPRAIRFREPRAMAEYAALLADDVAFHAFLQYEFDRQWQLLKQYAAEKGVRIIGDLPIFVALDSADVWANTGLFALDRKGYPSVVAGVPPDYFSETGQLWGNPLYAWQKHRATGYAWWIKRIAHALTFVDLLRIDHFRGFESYWAVPAGETTAIHGKWMKGPGKGLFDKIRRALGDLPIIAEDLGLITEAVETLRDDLLLPGMKVLQFGMDTTPNNTHMPHNITTTHVVLYTGTHDNDTTLGWYCNADPAIQDQARRYLNVTGDNIAWDCIRLAFLSIAVFAVVPIQDVMGLGSESRMNTPGVCGGNWRFRYTADMLSGSLANGLRYLSALSDRNYTE